MDILIRPALESLMEDEDSFDENDEDALAFEQGVDSWPDEVEPGGTFEIPEGHEGVLEDEIMLDKETEYVSVLSSGTYRLSEDGQSILRLYLRSHI